MEPSDATPPASFELEQLVGDLFADRYRVLRLVSEGAATALFDASDDESGRVVTLKLVRPRLAAAPSFRQRFDEQMRSAAGLSHPNIAAIYDWGIAQVGTVSTAYVVIEQLTGGSLRDMLDRNRRLSPSQALAVGLDACRGLDYAHRRGLVHSELTPSKLVFGDDRRLRIIDFGLAKLLNEATWETPDSVASHNAWYASPEQGLGQPIDDKTDVYALCLALQEMVTGVLPFKADSTVATLAARVGKLMPVSADLGPLAAVFERAGRPESEERSSAAEFGKGLVQAASKLPRPEPLPLFATGLFDTPADELRSPDDPTGGVHRPASSADTQVLVVPVDEPDSAEPADTESTGAISTGTDTAAGIISEPPPTEPITIAADRATEPSPDAPAPSSPQIIEAEPDASIPAVDPADDLVILPLDTGISADARPLTTTATTAPAATQTAQMPAQPAFEPQLGFEQGVGQPRRRRFPWRILISLIVIGALVALGILATQLFRTPTAIVPNLVGVPEAEARNVIAANGWVITVEEERSDDIPIVGQVVKTSPQAGIELAEGEPFLMVVSQGPTLRALPESTGKTLSEATIELDGLGLIVEHSSEYDEAVPVDTVISWSVLADDTLTTGMMVEPETVVSLVVSIGPAPRTVPNVVGLPIADATTAIEGVQLTIAAAGEEFSDDAPAGTVLSQNVDPETELDRGAEVTVIVSKGPDVVPFPDISGAATYVEAEQILLDAGFTAELTFGDREAPVTSYVIDGDEPDVGERFRRGTLVDFTAIE